MDTAAAGSGCSAGASPRFIFASEAVPTGWFDVVSVDGCEALSQPYRWTLVMVSACEAVDVGRLLSAPAALTVIGADGAGRQRWPGCVTAFEQLHESGGYRFCRVVLEPALAQLGNGQTSRIHVDELTVPALVAQVLAAHGAAGVHAFRLHGQYRPRSYVCQYQESDLAFVSRLLEREGIYYWFDDDGRLQLADDRALQPVAALTLHYAPAQSAADVGEASAQQCLTALRARFRRPPAAIVVHHQNHRKAIVDLTVREPVSADGCGEIRCDENYRDADEGRRYARLRAEQLLAQAQCFEGETTAVDVRSGRTIAIHGHFSPDWNQRYWVTSARYLGSQAGALLRRGIDCSAVAAAAETAYRVIFEALPATRQFRPQQITPKPSVAGVISATVIGGSDAAQLDAHGRYPVRMPFAPAVLGDDGDGVVRIRMATPYAGSQHGMHFPLHDGAEVLLAFAHGDPDQPVIINAVPNSENPNVITADNPHQAGVITRAGNQIALGDRSGSEYIVLSTPGGNTTFGLGTPNGDEPAVRLISFGGAYTMLRGLTQSEQYGPKSSIAVGTNTSFQAGTTADINIGYTTRMSLNNTVEWKMDMNPLADGDWTPPNISINDAKTLEFASKEKKLAALESYTISAGVDDAEIGHQPASSIDAFKTSTNTVKRLIGASAALQVALSWGGSLIGNTWLHQKNSDNTTFFNERLWAGYAKGLGDFVISAPMLAWINSVAKSLKKKYDDAHRSLKSRLTLDKHGAEMLTVQNEFDTFLTLGYPERDLLGPGEDWERLDRSFDSQSVHPGGSQASSPPRLPLGFSRAPAAAQGFRLMNMKRDGRNGADRANAGSRHLLAGITASRGELDISADRALMLQVNQDPMLNWAQRDALITAQKHWIDNEASTTRNQIRESLRQQPLELASREEFHSFEQEELKRASRSDSGLPLIEEVSARHEQSLPPSPQQEVTLWMEGGNGCFHATDSLLAVVGSKPDPQQAHAVLVATPQVASLKANNNGFESSTEGTQLRHDAHAIFINPAGIALQAAVGEVVIGGRSLSVRADNLISLG